MDEHVDGENQRRGRTGALGIRQGLADRDGAPRRQSLERFAQELTAALAAFAVKYMTDGGYPVTGAPVTPSPPGR